LSRKSSIVIEPAKEHKKSYILAGLSCILLGYANFHFSELSVRCGDKAVYVLCIGLIFSWALFHIHKFIAFKRNSKSFLPYFRSSNSPYFEEFLEDIDEDQEDAGDLKF
jgi:hypothetical protein